MPVLSTGMIDSNEGTIMTNRTANRMPKSKFLEVKCKDCENTQLIFSKASTQVTCQVCGATLAFPTGGKARIVASITGVQE